MSAIRTAAELIDFNAEKTPNHHFCIQTNHSDSVSHDLDQLCITYQTDRTISPVLSHEAEVDLAGARPETHDGSLSGDIEKTILEYLQDLIWPSYGAVLSRTQDLFEQGMGSLQANHLRHFVMSELQSSHCATGRRLDIPKDFVYIYPSISKIATYLRGFGATAPDEIITLDRLEQRYVHSSSPNKTYEPGATILLTGGTGALGCHLVAHLISRPTVSRIVCLNRSGGHLHVNPDTRQYASHQAKGAPIPLSSLDRLEILESDMALPLLGLPEPVFWGIASTVTHIVLNAWPVDFKRTTESFQRHFTAMFNLLKLARESMPHPPSLWFRSLNLLRPGPFLFQNFHSPFCGLAKCLNDFKKSTKGEIVAYSMHSILKTSPQNVPETIQGCYVGEPLDNLQVTGPMHAGGKLTRLASVLLTGLHIEDTGIRSVNLLISGTPAR
ncbi:hypothetical protein B0J11DRAFT_508381 [Dendryphion nanum]|uniref:Thioester reductase (TE) domain-containing protein n=1 Tax=Dendryphion nanum TaxID=256645 RepID=A0A9P9DIE6_9PLEO|nr:hypothetical protein B0J11DRAFT_508381 [Dendryphion nanum]